MTHYSYNRSFASSSTGTYLTCEKHDWQLPKFEEYSRPLTLSCNRCSGKKRVMEGELLPEEVWEEYELLKEYITLKNRGYMR